MGMLDEMLGAGAAVMAAVNPCAGVLHLASVGSGQSVTGSASWGGSEQRSEAMSRQGVRRLLFTLATDGVDGLDDVAENEDTLVVASGAYAGTWTIQRVKERSGGHVVLSLADMAVEVTRREGRISEGLR